MEENKMKCKLEVSACDGQEKFSYCWEIVRTLWGSYFPTLKHMADEGQLIERFNHGFDATIKVQRRKSLVPYYGVESRRVFIRKRGWRVVVDLHLDGDDYLGFRASFPMVLAPQLLDLLEQRPDLIGAVINITMARRGVGDNIAFARSLLR